MRLAFNVEPKILRAMLRFASEDESRIVLCGLHFETTKDKVLIVATDGRALGVYKLDDAPVIQPERERFNFTLTSELIGAALGAAPDDSVFYCADCDGESRNFTAESPVMIEIEADEVRGDITHPIKATISKHGVKFCGVATEQHFPAWRSVIPKEFRDSHTTVSAHYLKPFAGVARDLSPNTQQLRFRGGENNKVAYHIEVFGVPNFFGILMPCKDDREQSELSTPAWLDL